jgi:small-conductance mechanosensitive channel
MIDDGTLSLLLEILILVAAALWGILFLISKDLRDMIIYWRRKFSRGSIIAKSKEEFERLSEENKQEARKGQRVTPVGYIHLDSNLKFNITILNIFTFIVIISGIISLLLFRNNIFSSIAIGSFIELIGMYFLYGIFQLKNF